MSAKFAIIPAEACFDPRITSAALRTLVALAYYGGSRGRGCWPSYGTISKELSVSRRIVISHIKLLCECGYVVKESRVRKDGGSSSNTYRVNIDLSLEVTDGEQDITPPGDAHVHSPSVSEFHRGGDTQHHPLYMNNKTEQQKKNTYTKKVLLSEWESAIGSKLCIQQLTGWVKENRLDAKKIETLIIEFRESMESGGNKYADFTAAFKVWLRKNYLSLKFEQVKLPKGDQGKFAIYDKGLSL